MKNLLSIIITLGLFALSITFGVAKDSVTKEFHGIKTINIVTVSGSCEIIKGTSDVVKIELSYDYKPAGSFEPVFDQKKNTLRLKELMHGSNSGFSNWKITVPDHVDINFESASGGITLKDIAGTINVNTASGNIVGKGIKILAESKFNTASGNVSVALDESPKHNMIVATASGDASLDFNNSPVTGTIEMRSRADMGKIVCPIKFQKEKEQTIGRQKYVVKSFEAETGGPLIKIHTASGKAILKR